MTILTAQLIEHVKRTQGLRDELVSLSRYANEDEAQALTRWTIGGASLHLRMILSESEYDTITTMSLRHRHSASQASLLWGKGNPPPEWHARTQALQKDSWLMLHARWLSKKLENEDTFTSKHCVSAFIQGYALAKGLERHSLVGASIMDISVLVRLGQ